MANINMQEAPLVKETQLKNTNFSLLGYDNNSLYKFKVNKDTLKLLNNQKLLVGQTTNNNGEIFNDYTNNSANYAYSHVEGSNNEAGAEYQHIEGKFNEVKGSDYVHIVGYGDADNDRRNIYTLDRYGNIVCIGDITANGISLKALNNVLQATGSGNRRPVVRFGEKDPNSSQVAGEIGDIYCKLI